MISWILAVLSLIALYWVIDKIQGEIPGWRENIIGMKGTAITEIKANKNGYIEINGTKIKAMATSHIDKNSPIIVINVAKNKRLIVDKIIQK